MRLQMWWLNVFRSRFIGFDKKPTSLAVSPVGRQCSQWNILHITHRMKISFTSPRSQSTETWKTRKHARLDVGFFIFIFEVTGVQILLRCMWTFLTLLCNVHVSNAASHAALWETGSAVMCPPQLKSYFIWRNKQETVIFPQPID